MICLPLFVPWPEVTFAVPYNKDTRCRQSLHLSVMLFRAELWPQEVNTVDWKSDQYKLNQSHLLEIICDESPFLYQISHENSVVGSTFVGLLCGVLGLGEVW